MVLETTDGQLVTIEVNVNAAYGSIFYKLSENLEMP